MKYAGISAFLLASALCAQQPPQTMTRMVVQRTGSDIPHGSFAFKPRTFYRAGTTYCRIEEQPDPERVFTGWLLSMSPIYGW